VVRVFEVGQGDKKSCIAASVILPSLNFRDIMTVEAPSVIELHWFEKCLDVQVGDRVAETNKRIKKRNWEDWDVRVAVGSDPEPVVYFGKNDEGKVVSEAQESLTVWNKRHKGRKLDIQYDDGKLLFMGKYEGLWFVAALNCIAGNCEVRVAMAKKKKNAMRIVGNSTEFDADGGMLLITGELVGKHANKRDKRRVYGMIRIGQ
jgi:hypothetical protein